MMYYREPPRMGGCPICDTMQPKQKSFNLCVFNEDAKEWQNLICGKKTYESVTKAAEDLKNKTGRVPIVSISGTIPYNDEVCDDYFRYTP